MGDIPIDRQREQRVHNFQAIPVHDAESGDLSVGRTIGPTAGHPQPEARIQETEVHGLRNPALAAWVGGSFCFV